MDLSTLGWSDCFAGALSQLEDPELLPGRVVNEDRHAYTVVTAGGELPATITGRLLHTTQDTANLPKIGDWVALTPVAGESKGIIRHVLPRRTRLGRRLPGRETQEQILAANVDIAFVVQSLDANFNARRLERFLVMVHDGGVRPVVVLNKADLCSDVDGHVARARAVCGDTEILVTSLKRRRGLKQLSSLIAPAQTVVFIGSSGVGKSTLINSLYGEEIQATIEVRDRDSKGRHTTSARELIPLPSGGLVIDTPGMRELQVWLAEEGLDDAFPDIRVLANGCRFRDCRHQKEPECAVRVAADSGSLPRNRYDAYLKLQGEQKNLADQRREHTYVIRRRAGRQRTRPGDLSDDEA
ncbi:MAG: ribosome small subunit-dependent GTPase [Verrucomicrobiota bacterium]|jgi:ribosome biogenesis GTPase